MKYVLFFFDIRKAFDSVPHRALMEKMRKIGLDDHLLGWLHNYLSNRSQVGAADGELSNELSVLSGVPQGSVLGSLLFLVYVNDVTNQVSAGSNIVLFADDIALYRTSPVDYIQLQSPYLTFWKMLCHAVYQETRNFLPPTDAQRHSAQLC